MSSQAVKSLGAKYNLLILVADGAASNGVLGNFEVASVANKTDLESYIRLATFSSFRSFLSACQPV